VRQEELTDDKILAAFEGTNFGQTGLEFYYNLLARSVLKHLCGYYCGHTIDAICIRLGLITEKLNPTKTGKRFAYGYYDVTLNRLRTENAALKDQRHDSKGGGDDS
jgi:hypothetical protein